MEIEKKFRIDGDLATLPDLTTMTHLGSYRLRPSPTSEQQANHYYDTADHRLLDGNHSLRIRAVGSRHIATIKGPGQAEAGLFRRGEWEVDASDPQPATWPESEARTVGLRLVGDTPLELLFTVYTERHIIVATRDDQDVAELSLDNGSVQVGTHRDTFVELEIELLPAGTEDDIAALEAALHTHLPLVPENRTKFARGLALLEHERKRE